MPRQFRHRTEYSGVYFVELANQVQSFFIRYKRNGKNFEEKAGRSNQGWNAEKAYQMRSERKSGIYTADGEMQSTVLYKDRQHWTFSTIFAEYLRIRRELKGRENDVYRFKNYLEMEFADKTPEDVTLGDVGRIRQNLQNKRLKPATVRHALELLRRLANFAAKKKLCPGLRFKIEMPRVENHKTESLTQDQLQKLLDVLDEEQDVQVSNLVRLALFTGMRRGELFSLSWSDIDFHNKTITIRSGNNGQHSTIPLNGLAENVLIEHAQAEAGSKFVFPGRGGKKRTECKRPLLRIKLKAGLPDDFRILQGLRHVYASMLASSGNIQLETLQALLTHKSSLMTQRYAHLLDESQKNSNSMAGEKANSVLDSAEKGETLWPLGEELEEDFVEDYMGIEIATEAEETTHVEDDLSIHIAQVVEEEVCLQNKNKLTESEEKDQKNKNLDLYVDSEPLQEEIYCSDNMFAEFFETNKNLTYSDKNASTESTEPAASTEEVAQAIEVEETIESLCQIGGGEEGTIHSENVTAGTVEEALEIEEIAETEFVLGVEQKNIVKANHSPDQHCEVREEDSSTENVVLENDEDSQNKEFICKISKLEPEIEKKESFLNQVHKQDLSLVTPKEKHVNEVLKAKNLAAEHKVRQKARPSLEELKNDLKSLSQLIHSAPRLVKTSAVNKVSKTE